MTFQTLKRKYEEELIKSGGIKIAKDSEHLFTLRSNVPSWIYFDHGDLICNKEGDKAFIDALRIIIEQNFPNNETVLLNVLSKCSAQITGAVAYASDYSQIPLQTETARDIEKGTMRVLRLPDMRSIKTIVIVDDILTSGGTAIETFETVKKYSDLNIEKLDLHIVVGLARNPQDAIMKLKQYNITAHWLTTGEKIITKLWSTLTDEQKKGLQTDFPDIAL